MTILKNAWAALVGFFGPPLGAIRGYVNVVELGKAVILGLVAGGGVLGVLTQVDAASGIIFPSPGDDALVAAVLSFLADVFRRVPQGRPPVLPTERAV